MVKINGEWLEMAGRTLADYGPVKIYAQIGLQAPAE